MHTTLCECGCGGAAPLVKRTCASKNLRKGDPLRFISGHNGTLKQTLTYFMANVLPLENGCWQWTAGVNRKGYGVTQLHGVKHHAHKTIYLLHGESVPDGFHLDHLCRNKICVNPAHMEPVTLLENVRRQHAAQANRLREICAECSEVQA